MSIESSKGNSKIGAEAPMGRGYSAEQHEKFVLVLTPEQKEKIISEMGPELDTPIPEKLILREVGFGSQYGGYRKSRCFEMLPDGKVKTWIEELDENKSPGMSTYGEEVWDARTAQHLVYEDKLKLEAKNMHYKEKLTKAIEEDAKELLPFELTDYINSISTKHWGEGAVGSRFFGGNGLVDLLIAAVEERGDLDGDDREMIIEKGVDPSALMPECRYLVVPGGGEVGVVKAEELPDETEVKVVRTKPGAPCSLVVEGNEFPTADFGVIVIGPNNKEKPEDPEPSTKEMVWTAHPGLPIRPAKADTWPDGSTITVADVKAKLGAGAYLQFSRTVQK